MTPIRVLLCAAVAASVGYGFRVITKENAWTECQRPMAGNYTYQLRTRRPHSWMNLGSGDLHRT